MSTMRGFDLLADAASSTQNLSIFDPASPPAESIRNLALLVLAITGFIFLVVEGALLYSIVRFRQPPGAGPDEPPQVYGSLPIEIAWTAAPALIVFLLILLVARTEYEVRVDPAHPPEGSKPLYVTVVGHQWWWEYRYYGKYYEDSNKAAPLFITANELHVPASDERVPRPVYLTLLSADVAHSYWVPRLAGKTDLIPGRTNQMWFQGNEPGLYFGQCAEYCGTQHANMLLRVYVDPLPQFEAWRANEKKEAVVDAAGAAGRKVFLAQACLNCHRIRGTRAKGTFGPDLTHLGARDTLAAGMVPNTRRELHRWLRDPQQTKPGCRMPAMKLSESQIDQLVNYLRTLR
jgi:cytochrome c oxidase subunit 2